MSPIVEATTPIEKVRETIDDLALQTIVQGAEAITSETLSRLIEDGGCANCTNLVDAARSALASLNSSTLTDEDATSLVSRLRSLLPVDNTSPEADEEMAANSGNALDFKNDPEILADFVLESREHLAAIEEQILLLEKDPSQIDTIHGVFRSFHTIKGIAGFIGLSGVQSVAHEVETLLDHARNLRITITSEFVDLVLDSSGYLKEEVEFVQANLNGAPPPPVRDNTVLIRTLSTATANVATSLASSSSEATPSDKSDNVMEAAEAVSVLASAPPPILAGSEILYDASVQPDDSVRAVASRAGGVAPSTQQTAHTEIFGTSLRVETSKIDRLMDMVGEMVIAQSILSNSPQLTTHGNAGLAGKMSQLARITGEVQRCAMSMRMMPIGLLFQKNAKMVRDLSRRNGKQVSLELDGESTELDKAIAEELADPLLHMIRNALDHGIESPEERIAAGKSPVASLRIAAGHQSGQIVISIADDGRGLDPQRILNKAIQKGLVEQDAQLSQEEIFRLIFAPGFSTAEKITDISGRGVGMDVVRQHVEALRGQIEIKIGVGERNDLLHPSTSYAGNHRWPRNRCRRAPIYYPRVLRARDVSPDREHALHCAGKGRDDSDARRTASVDTPA